ncbi:dephospho-CoA kinase [Thiomicrorhabdus sp.]|uniref:dephospho-CoA kinase n=1 Tax=Thiomicrorhabdus sp. TaxID=2039724 RepID=UPI002AA689F1|nr:dephospho-CoA kinase [Thiomicrorhabdus sp.]
MTTVIGLTGGIGSGKSTVTNLLAQQGIPIIDTDIIARQVVEPGSDGLQQVVSHFGEACLNQDKTLNRAYLRELIFNDKSAKKTLESILHPLIKEETLKQIAKYRSNNPRFIVVAIPLLIESIEKHFTRPGYLDEVWVVDCSVEQQIERAMQRDGNNRDLIIKIIAQQASREQRLEHADFVIDNSKTIEHLTNQLRVKLNS